MPRRSPASTQIVTVEKVVLIGASAVAAICALLLAVLPTVRTIGVAAPILFTVVVALQVTAAGAEWPLLAAYVAEPSPPRRRGFLTSFASGQVCLGWLVAIVVPLCLHAALSDHQYSQSGWRVAFLPAVGLGLLSVALRLRLPESAAFIQLRDRSELSHAPLGEVFSRQPGRWLLMLLQVGAVSAAGVPGLCGAVIDAPSARDPAYLVAGDAEPGRAWRTVSIPVIVGGDVVGAVSLATRRTWGLGRHDIELVERFARMVARDLGASRGTAEDRSGDARGAA